MFVDEEEEESKAEKKQTKKPSAVPKGPPYSVNIFFSQEDLLTQSQTILESTLKLFATKPTLALLPAASAVNKCDLAIVVVHSLFGRPGLYSVGRFGHDVFFPFLFFFFPVNSPTLSNICILFCFCFPFPRLSSTQPLTLPAVLSLVRGCKDCLFVSCALPGEKQWKATARKKATAIGIRHLYLLSSNEERGKLSWHYLAQPVCYAVYTTTCSPSSSLVDNMRRGVASVVAIQHCRLVVCDEQTVASKESRKVSRRQKIARDRAAIARVHVRFSSKPKAKPSRKRRASLSPTVSAAIASSTPPPPLSLLPVATPVASASVLPVASASVVPVAEAANSSKRVCLFDQGDMKFVVRKQSSAILSLFPQLPSSLSALTACFSTSGLQDLMAKQARLIRAEASSFETMAEAQAEFEMKQAMIKFKLAKSKAQASAVVARAEVQASFFEEACKHISGSNSSAAALEAIE